MIGEMARLVVSIVVLIALLTSVVYLDAPTRDADVVIINSNDAFTLDPQRMSYLHDFRVGYALYEGLVKWNNEDFSIEPGVAESWTISDDGRTYRFRLARDARWSNGEPVTAHDFVFSLRRLLLPDTVADYSNLMFMIDGAEAFFEWRRQQAHSYADGGELSAEAAERLWQQTIERFNATVGVKAIDDQTLEIRLARPTPYILDLLCFAVCCPVHRPTVEGWPADDESSIPLHRNGWHTVEPPPIDACRWVSLNPLTGRLEQRHEWARPGRLVGNGPYILADWRYKRDMLLRRSEHFHRPDIMRNDSVLILTIEDANTRVLAFDSGIGDWVTDVGVEYKADMLEQRNRYVQRHAKQFEEKTASGATMDEALAALPPPRQDERLDVHPIPAFGVDFYSFNCRETLAEGRDNPFADARVRRAFVQAVDRERIVREVTRLNEPVMTTLIPPGSLRGYDSPAGLSHDIESARAELAAAGWRDRNHDGLVEDESGQPFPAVEILWTPSMPRYRWISLELKNQWQRTLGVQVELRAVDTKFYREDLRRGNFMIARGRWYGDYGDPTTFLDLNRCDDGNNDRGFCNQRVEQLLGQAAAETDEQRRMQLLAECEKLIVRDEVPMLVLCQLVELYMYDPTELRGISTHPRLTQQLWKLHVRKD